MLLCVPFRAQSENLTNLKEALDAGQILVDATVPLAAAVSGKATRLLGVPQGSAAEQAQEMVPEGVTVVSALHTVSAPVLGDLDRELDEDVLIAGDSKDAKAAVAERHRPHRRAAAGERGPARAGAPHRGAHSAADLGEHQQQDARRHPPDRPAGAPLVALLSGGTGGAKLARGLPRTLGDLAVIANTGDDVEVYGVHVSPDPDLVTYWLADAIDERGYGIRGDTFEVLDALAAAGRPTWFRLGDRDLAMCLIRTELLHAGQAADRGARRGGRGDGRGGRACCPCATSRCPPG